MFRSLKSTLAVVVAIRGPTRDQSQCRACGPRMSRPNGELESGGPPPVACQVVGVGQRQVIRRRKGTAVSNTYQKNSRLAEPDPLPGEITVPEQLLVSMAEIAGVAREGLLALAVGPACRS